MRMLLWFGVCVCLYLTVVTLRGQTPVGKPTNDEAKSACLTLEHLLVIARNNNQVQDAAALCLSYNIVRKYVTDPASVKGADEYVQYFVSSHPDLAAPTSKPTGGFTWIPAENDLLSDQKHQSGVIVYGKNGSMENLHFTLDKDSVAKLLKDNGAVAAEAAKP
jgi:hypothetical protein